MLVHPTFWNRAGAMGSESFGQVLRRLRHERGLSLRRLAGMISFDYTYLSKVEIGQQPGSLDLAQACDHALDAGGQLVARYTANPEPEDLASMLRRTLLAGSVGLWTAEPLGAAAVTGSTRLVGTDTAADLKAIAAAYRRSYRMVPAAQLLSAAHAHLELAVSLRPAQQPDGVRLELVSVIGEMAALAAAVSLLDLGKPEACGSYLNVAWQAARAIGSAELQSVVLGCRSFAVAYGPGRDHRQGLEFAEIACEIAATGACPETRGWVAAIASERHASLGDLSTCQRRLHDSRVALDARGDDGPRWLGLGGFNETKLLAYEGGDMVRLRRWADAEPVLDAAVARFGDDMVRHRCTALLDRAEARLGADELDAACVDGVQSLALVAQVQHAQNLKRLDALSQRAAATGAACGVALRRELVMVKADLAGVVTV
jgi:transcriptional regulator with XRE-family HTH domain